MGPSVEFLYKAIEDAQNTIRFVDTKAGLVLVGLTIISTFMSKFASKLWVAFGMQLNFFLLIGIISAISTIIFFLLSGLICFKAVNPLSSPVDHVKADGFDVEIPFYLWRIEPNMSYKDWLIESKSSKLNYNIKDLSNSFFNANEESIISSLTLELAKVSYIREKKIYRINRSIVFFECGLILWFFSLIVLRFTI